MNYKIKPQDKWKYQVVVGLSFLLITVGVMFLASLNHLVAYVIAVPTAFALGDKYSKEISNKLFEEKKR